MILGVVSLSSYLRTMAQLMIEDRFPKVQEKEEKPQKEKKKKEKSPSPAEE
jgi:hypothetical protein